MNYSLTMQQSLSSGVALGAQKGNNAERDS